MIRGHAADDDEDVCPYRMRAPDRVFALRFSERLQEGKPRSYGNGHGHFSRRARRLGEQRGPTPPDSTDVGGARRAPARIRVGSPGAATSSPRRSSRTRRSRGGHSRSLAQPLHDLDSTCLPRGQGEARCGSDGFHANRQARPRGGGNSPCRAASVEAVDRHEAVRRFAHRFQPSRSSHDGRQALWALISQVPVWSDE